MSNSYKYDDHDYIYIDPQSGILKNLPGITDKTSLQFFESTVVAKRLQELSNKIEGIKTLF